MIWKNFKFKNLNFSDEVQVQLQQEQEYSYPLQNVKYEIQERTQTFLNENYHGGLLSSTLFGVRYFDFEGVAIGLEKEQRGIVYHLLRTQLNIEANPQKNPYYHLFWMTDDDRAVFCKAKVTKAVSFQNDLNDVRMSYDFQLASPSEKYYGVDLKVVERQLGSAGGTALETWLSTALGGYGGEIVVENKGNRQAPIRLEVEGRCTNLKILNLTNGQKFRVEAITEAFVYDNQNLDFLPNKELVVEDNGKNIKPRRSTGGQIYLEAWFNRLVVLTDIPSERANIKLYYRDTYS